MKKLGTGAALSLLLVACSADRPPPREPASTASPPPAAQGQMGGYAQPGYQPQPYPSQPAGSSSYAPAPPPPALPGQPAKPSLQASSADLDKAARELDVAAGDCTTACRALASMDRAAGRICNLSSGSDEDGKRCTDAKERVYSARDKVKSTCNVCSDTSVERRDPIPSGRGA